MNDLPKDPILLLSVVNKALRDRFPTLDRFCAANGCDKEELIKKLEAADYTYDPAQNQFI